MPHSDDDTLALLALGEHVSTADTEHVAGCAHCTGELARLTAVVEGVRSGTGFGEPLPPPVAPPPSVWAAIAAETGVGAYSNGSAPAPARRAAAVPPRVPAPRRRNSSSWLIAAAATVAGVVLGVAGTLALGRDDDPPPAAAPLAETRLAGLPPAPQATGDAEVVGTASGRTLVVDVRELGASQGFYEVWLIDSSVEQMYPIGILRDGHGEFSLPDGVNLRDFPIVDVSLEPLDGDPAHSGTSVVRGTLPT